MFKIGTMENTALITYLNLFQTTASKKV